MPVMECTLNDKKGYSYGKGGTCYTYKENDEESRKEAKRKAFVQGYAIDGKNMNIAKEEIEDILEPVEKEKSFEILKAYDEQQIIFGWAYVAVRKDGSQVYDHSGQFISKENIEDLEMAVYEFNLNERVSGFGHKGIAKGHLIESIVFTDEKIEAMKKSGHLQGELAQGTWMGFFYPDREDYMKIKSMKNPMFSIEGTAIIEEVEI